MPELPEVETTRRGIAPHIEGKSVKKTIIRNANLRWPIDKKHLQACSGKNLKNVSRRGKYLLLEFSHGVLLWHLGMSGSLRIIHDNAPAQKHDHVDMVFENSILRFNDPRRFGAVIWAGTNPFEHKLLQHLGPEPLSDTFNPQTLFKQSRKRSQAIKTFIMDATTVVGVGNIYANEALFAARIHPLKAAGKVTKKQYEALVPEIKKILSNAINRGGTTLRDFVGGDGKPGYFAQELKVYGRANKPCKSCGKSLLEKRLSNRSTVYCSDCQQ